MYPFPFEVPSPEPVEAAPGGELVDSVLTDLDVLNTLVVDGLFRGLTVIDVVAGVGIEFDMKVIGAVVDVDDAIDIGSALSV